MALTWVGGNMADEDKKGRRNVLEAIKKAVELCMPDLRHYYRMPKKARIAAAYAADGSYYADVQPLRNDGTEDAAEPLIPRVELPVLWGGPDRGVVCPPEVGSLCDVSYYDGDPNYPFISNIRWGGGNATPCAELKEFVIQLENGVEIRIDKEKQIVTLTPQNVKTEAGKGWTVKAGDNASIEAGSKATITAGGEITLEAPQIFQNGNVTTKGAGGSVGTVEENANRTQRGNLTINGNLTVNGNTSTSGVSYAGSRSGGPI